jgi:hypothetical protein
MKSKRIKFVFFLYCLPLLAISQPQIQWQRNFGGQGADEGTQIIQTTDSGYVLVGVTDSNNGDVNGNHGSGDFWIVRLSNDGVIEWKKCLGGSSTEKCYSVSNTNDSGFILAGQSSSNNGNVSGNHGGVDCWVVKLNNQGILEWQRSYGGSALDEAWSIQSTTDGGYVFAGRTSSHDGDITDWYGGFDYWVVKLNSTGEIDWQKTIGGTGYDMCYSIKQTFDGGYILIGESNSTDGDVLGLIGSSDFWVVKLSSTGIVEWQKTLGSSSLDRGNDIIQLPTGEFLAFGHVSWQDGDVTLAYGGYDYWVAKLSHTGDLIWQRTYGGTGEDFSSQINPTQDGGFILVGSTNSKDFDIVDNNGGVEYLIMKADSTGQLQWQRTLGGTKADRAFSGIQTSDNGYILTGYSWSNNGDSGGNYGENDFWVVKLAPETSSTQTPSAIPLNLYPNPAQNWFRLNLPITEPDMQISITDAQGRVVLAKTIRSDERLDVAALEPGVYGVSALAQSGQVYAGKLVKE